MSQRISLLILTFLLNFTACYTVLDPATRPLLSFLVDTSPTSECLSECIEPLKRPLIDFVNEEITLKYKDKICSAYKEAIHCVHNNTNCTAPDRSIMKKLTYGFDWACGAHGYDPLKYINPCIVTLGKEVRQQGNCQKECNLELDSNKIFVPNFPNLIGKFEPMCGPLACFLNCTAKQINSYCPTGGSRLVNIVVSAFDELVEEFKRTTRAEQKYIFKLVPAECRLFFNEREMMALRFDEQFVTDLFLMITSRKQRSRQTARTEAERIISGLLRNMEKEMATPEVLVWDLEAVSICAAIIVVMILNVAGLIFTVWWCVTSKEDNIEYDNSSKACMNHFVEPNIRMKLKLPKIRADAVHDSAQEVFELRVPRNGNQFHQNDEQTVVVPRYKRRRTYSVPLEPRPRTQSTGSEQVSPLVIVRN